MFYCVRMGLWHEAQSVESFMGSSVILILVTVGRLEGAVSILGYTHLVELLG